MASSATWTRSARPCSQSSAREPGQEMQKAPERVLFCVLRRWGMQDDVDKMRAVLIHRPRDILSLSTTGYGCKLFQLAITQLIDLFCKQLAFLFRAAATRNHPLPIRIKCNIGVTLSFRQFCRCHPMHIRYHNLIAVRIKHWRSVFFEQMCTNVNIRIPRNMSVRMLPAINGYPI